VTIVAAARETQRIVRDRYDAGSASVTEVLHAATLLLDAEALDIGARVEAQAASVALERAIGRRPAAAP
jgi:outer membrane protein TolC